MKSIGVISDTHNHLDEAVLKHFSGCDEIWHAGDIGDYKLIESLQAIAPVKAVFGNIDDTQLQRVLPEKLVFYCEGVKVYMIHIGGSPPKYAKGVLSDIKMVRPQLFVCGHSHILKIIPDNQLHKMLYLNPGAAGRQGFHKMRTVVRFVIDQTAITNLEVIELGLRGSV